MMSLNPEDRIPGLADWADHSRQLIAQMSLPCVYPHRANNIRHHETHISHVFLAGDFAYKIKKPIKTEFLDYSTLKKRRHYCEEEIRLDRRYAADLYIEVTALSLEDGKVQIGGNGEPIEYAVKMHRFPEDALLSQRVDAGLLNTMDVRELASEVADFHRLARPCEVLRAAHAASKVRSNLQQILVSLSSKCSGDTAATLQVVRDWSERYFTEYRDDFGARSQFGFIRECHGDLHLQNIVRWRNQWVPFDGIEFNEDLRWIDVASDSAFLAMDLAARDHLELSRSFVNGYLECTGDYSSLTVMRWYLVYRSLIRAMVAQMKAEQHSADAPTCLKAQQDCRSHIELAYRFTLAQQPSLMITHGLSGSGKTVASEQIIQRCGAIRLRSDVERKRLFGVDAAETINHSQRQLLYNATANERTYERLECLGSQVLEAGYRVIIDATFLRKADRDRFRSFAEARGVHFSILDCKADESALRQRIADRMAASSDASDADLSVLQLQVEAQEPLADDELAACVSIEHRLDSDLTDRECGERSA